MDPDGVIEVRPLCWILERGQGEVFIRLTQASFCV